MLKTTLKHQRILEKRKFFIIYSSDNDEMFEEARFLKAQENKIIEEYQAIIDNINKYTNYVLRKFDFKFEVRSYSHKNVDVFLEEQDYPCIYRGATILADVECINDNILHLLGVSHFLYLLKTSKKKNGWGTQLHNDCTSFNARHEKGLDSCKLFCSMIVDLLVDISTFNSMDWFIEYVNSLNLKKEISALKYEFINNAQEDLAPYYGPVCEDNLPYVSFATIIRDSLTTFDKEQCQEYASLLNSFCDFAFAQLNFNLPDISTMDPDVVMSELKKYYKGYGHLKTKKVFNLIQELSEAGKYCLITYKSRCDHSDIHAKNKLANLFRVDNLDNVKLHTPQLIPWEKFSSYAELNNYLSFFLFSVNDNLEN